MDGSNPAAKIQTSGSAVSALSSPSAIGQLQVGYQDPELGYVELRAVSDGQGVHASLGTHSEVASTTLSGDLTALAAWMDARHTPVESLSVIAIHDGGSGRPQFTGFQAGADGLGGNHSAGTGGGGGQGPTDSPQTGPDAGGEREIAGILQRRNEFAPSPAVDGGLANSSNAVGLERSEDLAAALGPGNGGSISILA
jgi:hypothetical protein